MTKMLITLSLLLCLTPLAAAEPNEPADPDALRAELEQARNDLASAAQRVASLTRQLSEQGLARRWADIDTEQWRSAIGELPDGAAIRRAMAMAWAPRLGVVLGADDQADGRLVRAVTPGGSASAAGIEAGDRIISMDGVEIGPQAAAEVRRLLREREAGDTVVLEMERDGERRRVEVMLERPELPGLALLRGDGQAFNAEELRELIEGRMRPGRWSPIGGRAELTPMHAGLEPYFGIDRGVLVLRTDPEHELDLEAGDIILAINGQAVNRPTEVMLQLVGHEAGQAITLELQRRGERLTVTASAEAVSSAADGRRRGQRG